MGPRSHEAERLVHLAVAAIWVGGTLVIYQQVTAKLAAHGVGLSWVEHIALLALLVLLVAAVLVVVGLALAAVRWAAERLTGWKTWTTDEQLP